MQKESISTFVPIIISFVVLFLVKQTPWQEMLHPKIWYFFIFFAAVHFLIAKISDLGFEQDNFINMYLGSMIVRMILVILFLGAMLYLFPNDRKSALITSVVFYLFFSIFEISILLRKLRRF